MASGRPSMAADSHTTNSRPTTAPRAITTDQQPPPPRADKTNWRTPMTQEGSSHEDVVTADRHVLVEQLRHQMHALANTIAGILMTPPLVPLTPQAAACSATPQPPPTEDPDWLSTSAAAVRANRHPKTVMRAARTQALHGHQPAPHSTWRFRPQAVDAWILGESSIAACGCTKAGRLPRRR